MHFIFVIHNKETGTQLTKLKKVKLFTKLRKTNKLTGKLDEIQQISKAADNGGIQKAKEVLQGKVDNSLTWYNKLPQGLKNDIGDPASELGRYVKANGKKGVDSWKRLNDLGVDVLARNPEALKYLDDLKNGAKLGDDGVKSFSGIKSIWDKKFPGTVNSDGISKLIRHHAIEQKVLNKYPNLITKKEMHSISNLRGIPKGINSNLHLSKIRKEWNKFYKQFDDISAVPTKQQLLDKATEVDNLFGNLFVPPLK